VILFLVVLRALIFMISSQKQNSRRCRKKTVLFIFYLNSLVKFF